MPGLDAANKELKLNTEEIEKDQDELSADLDNMIRKEGADPDEETDADTEKEETDQVTETEDTEDKPHEEEAPEMKISGDNLISSEGNVSVDLNTELADSEAKNPSGTQTTEEEKAAEAESAKKPSDVFELNTGANRFSNEDMDDAMQQDPADPTKKEPEEESGGALNAEMETGAKKALSKPKKWLFSAIFGLKKAKKSIGNFFKKKLPKAFQSGGKAAKKALKYTPFAPMVSLIDKVVEAREKSRPERERKAKLKEEAKLEKKKKWLLDQDEKRHRKEEKERIKREKKELEAKAKAAIEEAKKNSNSLSYRTGKFFKGIWSGIKTGVKALAQKVAESQLGEFVGLAIKEVKSVVGKVKEKIGGVVKKVAGAIDQVKDDYDSFTFEDRMRTISEEERKKRERGEEVPDDDYRTRYLALTEELKGKLSSVRENISRREEIEAALSEMEGKESPAEEVTTASGEQVNAKDWTVEEKPYAWEVDLANLAIDMGASLLPGETEKEAFKSLGKIGSEAGRVDKYKKRERMMEAINSTSKDQLIKRMSKYAKDNAALKKMEAGFDVALNVLKTVEGAGKITGMAAVAGGASFLGEVTSGVKMLALSSKTRAGVKAGIKDMLGGKEGYYALKAKYKMHAPEMRRAVRDALGVATSADAVTADKWELSHLMHERTKDGTTGDIDAERMVAEAGGTTERKFDALQGAGTSVKRRNADRRRRMTA